MAFCWVASKDLVKQLADHEAACELYDFTSQKRLYDFKIF